MAHLAIDVRHRPGFHLVTLEGDLDRQTRPGLHRLVDPLLDGHAPRIVVDTAALLFCDSHGLSALVDSQQRAEERGGGLRLIGVQGTLAQLLVVTQLVDVFPPYTSLAQASRWPRRRG
ncbi:anti-sigma factor antagonist [Actinomadura sp. ATCC 31491]|uniref:Anti-sigma factor antagonist n=1 Tax=Actinomadura luzonensis TaxID=2805427 RepID=A0ABT0G8Z6_9ACTN|nr:anti-sigma factor antagonist [Actinomadura luzonensis]MCK2220964.1 anti-sigma factor antagonist [Actinomadura luzonensis]